MSTSLDAIFAAYDARKQTELEAAEHGSEKTRLEIEQGFAVLREKIIPALRLIEARVTAKGHKAKMTEKMGDTYPSVLFEFTPEQRTKGPPFHVASRIAFNCYAGSIETKSEIGTTAKQAAVRIKIEELGVDWVGDQVNSMIEAALARA